MEVNLYISNNMRIREKNNTFFVIKESKWIIVLQSEHPSIHIIKQSPSPHLSVCLLTKNSKTTERIFMPFSPKDRVILPENTGI